MCSHPSRITRADSSGRFQYPAHTCGPRIKSSPTSSGPHSRPSPLTILTSTWKSGTPTEPGFRRTSSAGSQKVLGPASVRP